MRKLGWTFPMVLFFTGLLTLLLLLQLPQQIHETMFHWGFISLAGLFALLFKF